MKDKNSQDSQSEMVPLYEDNYQDYLKTKMTDSQAKIEKVTIIVISPRFFRGLINFLRDLLPVFKLIVLATAITSPIIIPGYILLSRAEKNSVEYLYSYKLSNQEKSKISECNQLISQAITANLNRNKFIYTRQFEQCIKPTKLDQSASITRQLDSLQNNFQEIEQKLLIEEEEREIKNLIDKQLKNIQQRSSINSFNLNNYYLNILSRLTVKPFILYIQFILYIFFPSLVLWVTFIFVRTRLEKRLQSNVESESNEH